MTEPRLLGPDEPRLTAIQSGVAACLIDGMNYSQAAKAIGCSTKCLGDLVYKLRRAFRVRTTNQLMAAIGERL